MKTTQYLKMEFNNEVGTAKMIQDEMKTEVKDIITELENTKVSLTNKMDQAEDIKSELEDQQSIQIKYARNIEKKSQKKKTEVT